VQPIADTSFSEVYGRNRLVDAKTGYTNAVDLWSIGAITTVLLTGDVIFMDSQGLHYPHDHNRSIVDLAAQCDITVIDDETNHRWRPVSRRAKSFVKELLVLDETRRLTAKAALRHAWFTHPAYASELQQVYERAISDFKPSTERQNVQYLDTSWLGPSPIHSIAAAQAMLIRLTCYHPPENAEEGSP